MLWWRQDKPGVGSELQVLSSAQSQFAPREQTLTPLQPRRGAEQGDHKTRTRSRDIRMWAAAFARGSGGQPAVA